MIKGLEKGIFKCFSGPRVGWKKIFWRYFVVDNMNIGY